MWSSFEQRGARRLVVARIVESADDLDVVRAAPPHGELRVCRLAVEPETLQRRLRHREAGSSVEFLSSVTERLARTIGQRELPGVTVHNGDRQSISALAADVLSHLGWPMTEPGDPRRPQRRCVTTDVLLRARR